MASIESRRASNLADNKAVLALIMEEMAAAGFSPDGTPKTKRQTQRDTQGQKRKASDQSVGKRRKSVRLTLASLPTRVTRSRSGSVSTTASSSSNLSFEESLFVTEDESPKKRRKSGPPPKRAAVLQDLPSVEEITQKHLNAVAENVSEKNYDQTNGTSCHQCRQKTDDMKSICRAPNCPGIRGRFCGPCLRNRYGQSVKEALKNPEWICPPCRGRCNCSICRRRKGVVSTGILIHLAQEKGFSNVDAYLESLAARVSAK